MLLVVTLGCGPGFSSDEAQTLVRDAAAAANPQGRAGVELVGRSTWVEAPMFEQPCLHENDLAFAQDGRISPTWLHQSYITADTEGGWCLYMAYMKGQALVHFTCCGAAPGRDGPPSRARRRSGQACPPPST